MRTWMKQLAAATLATTAMPALAIDDGPRAYFPLPVGSNNFNLIGIFEDSNSSLDPSTAIKGLDGNIDVGVLQYTRTVAIGGNAAGLVVAMPFGRVQGEFALGGPFGNTLVRSGESSGLGDLTVMGVFGVIGSPALTKAQYVRYKPGFSLGVLAQATAPTGEYDDTKVLNLGTNRWAFRLGMPFGWMLGGSYLSPKLTTIEVVPSVIMYTPNDAPFRAGRRTQSALFRMEGHLTHNFNRALWASLDGGVNSGGATTTDGVADNNTKQWLGLGVSVGLNLSPAFGVVATYGGPVTGNASAPEGSGFRINLRGTF